MTATAAPPALARTHLSLNVADLAKSVAFYRVLFDLEPAKTRSDYAKFELPDPPVVLSLQPGPRPPGASLSHLGLRLPTADGVLAVQRRLEAAGVETRRQDGVVCGYARQSKCWAADPDGNFWEIYVLEADVDPAACRAHLSDLVPAGGAAAASAPATWGHSLGDPVPTRLPHPDDSLDEISLSGTWNAPLDDADRVRLLADVFRVLKPGGTVSAHGLAGDRPFAAGAPKLPGPAAVVGRVPLETDPARELAAAGFAAVRYVTLSPAAYLSMAGVEMREFRVTAVKPPPAAPGRTREVLYKGPLASVTDADGVTFPRGQRVAVSDRTWETLLAGPAAGSFVFAPPDAAPMCNAK